MINKKFKTKVIKTEDGHSVEFTIGCQTFQIKEIESEPEENSRLLAKWYKKCLDTALLNLQTNNLKTQPLIH